MISWSIKSNFSPMTRFDVKTLQSKADVSVTQIPDFNPHGYWHSINLQKLTGCAGVIIRMLRWMAVWTVVGCSIRSETPTWYITTSLFLWAASGSKVPSLPSLDDEAGPSRAITKKKKKRVHRHLTKSPRNLRGFFFLPTYLFCTEKGLVGL